MAAAAGCHCRVDGATSGDDNELLPDTHARTNKQTPTNFFFFFSTHKHRNESQGGFCSLVSLVAFFFGGGIEEAEETSLVVIEVIDDELLVADWMCLVGGQTETMSLTNRIGSHSYFFVS